MESKRFYWIKLKNSFYENNEAIDFLLTQPDGHGSDYVVLYQMLCLKSANNDGVLYSRVGEVIIPYDVDKIVRDCKYFGCDIVTNALGHYKKLGLIYEEQESGYLVISDINDMIGSETDSAERKRRQRNRQKAGQCHKNVTDNVPKSVTTEIRDKSIEIETLKEESVKEEKTTSLAVQSPAAQTIRGGRFTKPTLEEVADYCAERGNSIDPQRFIDYYTSKGWKVGNAPMKDWRAAVRTWERKDTEGAGQRRKKPQEDPMLECLQRLYAEAVEEESRNAENDDN